MHFENLCMVGVTSIDAPEVITSENIENRLRPLTEKYSMRPHFIQELAGIKARRYFEAGIKPSDAATQAAVKILEKTGINKNKIGVLLNTSVCRDFIEPSTAAIVHGNLEMPEHCINMDIGNACLAFMNGIELIGHMIERGVVDYGMIVNGENARYTVENTIDRLLNTEVDEKYLRDCFATLTFGSGAAAMILSRRDLHPEAPRIVASLSCASTQYNQLCRGSNEEILTDSSKLLIAGLEVAAKTYKKAYEEFAWADKNMSHYILHQVSMVHTQKVCEVMGVDIDKVPTIFPEYGNIGPASIPICLDKLTSKKALDKGSRLVLGGIGSGINCTMMEMIW